MTEDEFERNRLRFGDDIGAWPAPYRQEALNASGHWKASGDEQDSFDRLILEAVGMPTDEQALSRGVMKRVRRKGPTGYLAAFQGLALRPAGLAACAAVILAAFIAGGYQTARLQDDDLDSALLAFATGAPLSDGVADIPAGPATGGEPL
ncbi:hypothetical protein [Rhizobium binxianense]